MRLRTLLATLAVASSLAAIACGASSDDAAPDETPPAAGPATDPGSSSGGPTTQGSPQGAPSGDASTGDAGPDGSVPTVPKGSCGAASPAKGFLPSLSVKVGNATRTYALTVPSGYDGTKLYPIVVGFHGDGGNGAGYRASFPIEAQAPQGAIFAWPNGTNNNSGHSFDQAHDPPNNADVAFFDAMVAAIAATYCADKKRVYVHGMSGGAYFTNQIGRWRATAIRAIAPQSGGGPFGIASADYDPVGGALTVNGPVPAIMVHGLADTTVPISEGQQSLAYWRRADTSAAGQVATTPSPCQKQNGGTKPVLFCAVPGLQHAIWSGAPAAIWSFFAAN
ncbi:MAG TPA: PHB depolymerase family esterase [Labilithrix sp.]|nr:PHB depolymerase family esterase [Labilithrix sp.]